MRLPDAVDLQVTGRCHGVPIFRGRGLPWHDSFFATASAAKVAVPLRLRPLFASLSCHDSEGKEEEGQGEALPGNAGIIG